MGIVIIKDKIVKHFECPYCGSEKSDIIGTQADVLSGKEKDDLLALELLERKEKREIFRPILLCNNCKGIFREEIDLRASMKKQPEPTKPKTTIKEELVIWGAISPKRDQFSFTDFLLQNNQQAYL